MPRTSKPPAYRLHKASGQAVVTIRRKDHYLGPFGSAKSKEAYANLIAEFAQPENEVFVAPSSAADTPFAGLLYFYLQHAKTYYTGSELHHQRTLVKRLQIFAGDLMVTEFGPKRLRAFRETLIEEGLARTFINHTVNRIRTMFKWGVGQELVPTHILEALRAVEPLRFGKTTAKESEPVKPVPEPWIDAVLPYCSRQVQAMVQLQRITGMRSGEVCIMRTCDISTQGTTWTYTPSFHKTLYRGHKRVVYLGPQAQAVLRPWLRTQLEEFLFSPAEAEAERRELLRSMRRTPLSCGNVAGTNRKRKPSKTPGERYDSRSYHKALKYAMKRCNLDRQKLGEPEIAWHPHQLRHLAATNVRREFGLEVARVVLGHKHAAITETYAEADQAAAEEAMRRMG